MVPDVDYNLCSFYCMLLSRLWLLLHLKYIKMYSLLYTPCEYTNRIFLQVAVRLQKELDETNAKLKAKEEANNIEATKKKAPMLGTIGKVSSGEVS